MRSNRYFNFVDKHAFKKTVREKIKRWILLAPFKTHHSSSYEKALPR